jgi:hypothetical protein
MSCYPLPVETVLLPAFIPQYGALTASIFSEIVQLNTTLYIVNKIVEFPFHLFGGSAENVFFYMNVLNGTEIAIGIAYKLLIDTDRRSYGLLRLKNEILRNVRPEHLDDYREHLRNARIEAAVQRLLPAVEALRSNQVAHLSESLARGNLTIERPNVQELDTIRLELNRIYSCLSFNQTSLFVPLSYAETVIHPPGTDSRPDIVKLLDGMAMGSSLLTMPEREPDAWPYVRGRLSDYEVRKFNEYRRRCGFSEVDGPRETGRT